MDKTIHSDKSDLENVHVCMYELGRQGDLKSVRVWSRSVVTTTGKVEETDQVTENRVICRYCTYEILTPLPCFPDN